LYLLVSVFFWFVPFLASNNIKTKLICAGIFLATNLLALYYPYFTLISCLGGFVYTVIVMNSKSIPVIKKEESTYSREFWMFIGSLVLFLASFIIILKTSVPVYNKLFGNNIASPEDVPFSYNQIQVFIAIILGILTAVTQYFRYKDTPRALFGKKILLPTLIAFVISLSISLSGAMNYEQHGAGFMIAIHVALFAGIYGVVANVGYIWLGLKGKLKAAGASVAHAGFALLLVAILISSAKKEVLSWNTTGIAVFEKTKDQDPAENITLFKGIRTDMGKYDVTYVRDTTNTEDRKKYFELKFEGKDGKDTFKLYPDIMKINKGRQEPSANPDKKHYWNKDIFAYATTWTEAAQTDTTSIRPAALREGDTVFYSNGLIVLNKVEVNSPDFQAKAAPGETSMALNITVISKEGTRYPAKPGIFVNQTLGSIRNMPDTVIAQSLVLQFNKVADEKKRLLEIGVKENRNMNPLMTLKVYQFPFIALVWIGVIIMVAGFIMSIVQRVRNPLRTAPVRPSK
jgi:cytochrome c-type biogenesis protein CcmF